MKNSLFILLALITFSCADNTKIVKLQLDMDALIFKNDSLTRLLSVVKPDKNYWYSAEFDGAKLVDIGIEYPEAYIEKALREQPELIPLKAVLGGTMQFQNIQLLGSTWIIADYHDGHVDGMGIYTYTITNQGELKFKLLRAKS